MTLTQLNKDFEKCPKHNDKGISLMTLTELHAASIDYSGVAFDPRFNVAMNEGQFNNLVSNNGCNYYAYLYNVVKNLQPKNVVELGTSIGRSAMFMLSVLPVDSKLTTIDIGSFVRVELAPFEEDARLNIVYGSDIDEQTYGPLGLKDVDLLYIDTLHSYEHVVAEWAIYKQFLTPNAFVVMDDIHLNDGMTQFWNELPYEKIDIGEHVHLSGFGIFQYSA